jgi:hypothetical protein
MCLDRNLQPRFEDLLSYNCTKRVEDGIELFSTPREVTAYLPARPQIPDFDCRKTQSTYKHLDMEIARSARKVLRALVLNCVVTAALVGDRSVTMSLTRLNIYDSFVNICFSPSLVQPYQTPSPMRGNPSRD